MSAGAPVAAWAELSDVERQVARLATQGLSNDQIARRLQKSTHGVKSCLRRLFLKLQVETRQELAVRVAVDTERAALAARDEQLAVLVAQLGETGLDGEQRALVDRLQLLVTAGRSS